MPANPLFTVTKGAVGVFVVKFSPTKAEVSTENLSLTLNSGDVLQLTITGEGIESGKALVRDNPFVHVVRLADDKLYEPVILDLGQVPVSTFVQQKVVFKNVTGHDLEVDKPSIKKPFEVLLPADPAVKPPTPVVDLPAVNALTPRVAKPSSADPGILAAQVGNVANQHIRAAKETAKQMAQLRGQLSAKELNAELGETDAANLAAFATALAAFITAMDTPAEIKPQDPGEIKPQGQAPK